MVGINRLIMIAVGRRKVAASLARLKIVLAHQPPDFLVIDDHAAMPQLGANAALPARTNTGAPASSIALKIIGANSK